MTDMKALAGTAESGKKLWGLRRPQKPKKRMVFAAVLAVAVVAAVLIFRSGRQNAASEMSYTETAAARRDITNSLSGSGTLEPANSYTVTTLIEGEILSAEFEEGDIVDKDTVLYQVDSSDTANNIEKAQISLNQAQRSYESAQDKQYIKATISGQLFSLEVDIGDEVSQGQIVATIRDSDTMTLTVPFPADDAQSFYAGQAATVTLNGSFETLDGTVKSVSGSDIVDAGNSITRNVTIAVTNPGGLGVNQTATASVGGINCSGNGTFTYQAESTVTASASGTVVAVNAAEGSAVSKNQVILTLGGDDLDDQLQSASDNLRNAELSMESVQDQLENYTITAPISGTIVDKRYKAGETVEGGSTLCVIYDLSYLEMTLNIDELDISSVEVGQSVQITADAVEGMEYEGVITKVSVAGTTSGGITSYPVTIRLDETEGLRPGMNVDAEIVIEEAADVLSIPNAAVERNSLVLVTSESPSAVNAVEQEAPEGYVYVQVETGISDDDYIQITGGLQEGDTVAYIQKSASSSSEMMMGMPGGGMGGGMGGGGMPGGGGGGPGGGF